MNGMNEVLVTSSGNLTVMMVMTFKKEAGENELEISNRFQHVFTKEISNTVVI